MINQKIDTLKYLTAVHMMNMDGSSDGRLQLLDALLLLTINEHPDSSKTDYVEILYSDREATKSAIDRPINRLLDTELIERIENENADTKSGQGRMLYRLSVRGEKFLKRCGLSHENY